MLKVLIYGMIYLGSALMVYNIYCYVRYAQQIRQRGDWEQEERILRLPILLLVLFLLGYLAVGLFGKPDIIISGILFGGSVFVAIMVYLIRRVTNRIRKNEELDAKLMAAESTSRVKSVFLSNMSHEMRTPMNAILGLARLLRQDTELSPRTQAYLDQIEASARHMLAIVNEVLDMSEIYDGKMTLKEKPFNFNEVMMQFNTIVSSQCQDKGLSYNSQRLSDVDAAFYGDELKLMKALFTVADNAVTYTDAPGSVQCTVEQLEGEGDRRVLRFVLRDSGIGMSEEFLAHVFDAFSRETVSGTGGQDGSGLGLSIAKSIVELMGGDIAIDSAKGVGTAVTITVPLGAVEAEEPPAPQAAEVDLNGRRVLIAEDIDLNAEILADLLELEGVASERAENGQIAVDMFSEREKGYYDAILMDLRMPVMDGLEATRRIRALERPDAKTIPILALTANSFDEDVHASFDAGMNAHLSKPADIEVICGALREALK